MSEARIPSPADWNLGWDDIAKIVERYHARGRVTALIERFYITEATARAWLDGLHAWRRSVA